MTDKLKDRKIKLTEDVVVAATELGIQVVKEMIAGALHERPQMTLKEFTAVLDKYQEKVQQGEFHKHAARNN